MKFQTLVFSYLWLASIYGQHSIPDKTSIHTPNSCLSKDGGKFDDENCSTEDKLEDGCHIDWSLNTLSQDDPTLVKILKEKYLIKPSKKKLNLTSPPSQHSLKGQFGQPFLLDDKYFKNNKKNGFFIEAGSYDGETISNTLHFELKHQWTGLLVEPNPIFFNKLLTKNRNAWSLGHCLSTKTHPEVVMFDSAGIGSGIINTVTGRKPGSPNFNGPRSTIQLQCFPLYSILLALGNPKVDYFSLDVEGTELDILKTIPWNKVKISSLSVEVNHLGEVFPGNFSDVQDLMFENGYEYLGLVKIDAFFVKKKNKKKSK